MANTDAFALQKSDLNGFLFADVGVEASGNSLSVLSALARMGMDPWQEGGRLAKLPQLAAIDALARLIAVMPSSPWSLPDATAIASRLVALLPGRPKTPTLVMEHPNRSKTSDSHRQSAIMLAFLVMMGAYLIVKSLVQQGDGKDGGTSIQTIAKQPASPGHPGAVAPASRQ
jgi:hypothetical protein